MLYIPFGSFHEFILIYDPTHTRVRCRHICAVHERAVITIQPLEISENVMKCLTLIDRRTTIPAHMFGPMFKHVRVRGLLL